MPQDRRSFLRSLAGAASALVAGDAAATACAPPAPRVTPGLQLYTVRDELERDFAGTLARVAETGYRELEFAGYFGRSPSEVRELLERHGLRAPSTHIGYDQLSAGWDAVLRSARAIGHEFVTIPSLPGAERGTHAGLRRVAAAFNRGASEARAAGLRFAFHNHDIEFVPVDGVVPFAVLLEETDPELVTFELDVYWAFRAGRDPVELIGAHPRRFTMLHLKDSAGPPQHRMVDVGAGVIDFPAILAKSRAAGLLHFFVEHDRPENAFASIGASFAHLTSLNR